MAGGGLAAEGAVAREGGPVLPRGARRRPHRGGGEGPTAAGGAAVSHSGG